jgi:hypothetical protein
MSPVINARIKPKGGLPHSEIIQLIYFFGTSAFLSLTLSPEFNSFETVV